MALKYVQTVIFLVNLHGTPKQWAIATTTALKRVTPKFLEIQSAHYVFHHNPRIIVMIHIM
jgi:hypothetical protein